MPQLNNGIHKGLNGEAKILEDKINRTKNDVENIRNDLKEIANESRAYSLKNSIDIDVISNKLDKMKWLLCGVVVAGISASLHEGNIIFKFFMGLM